MVRNITTSESRPGKGKGRFRHRLLRLAAVAGVVAVLTLVITLVVASSSLAARRSPTSADEVQFFQGVKTCAQHSAPPLIVCVVTTSNVTLLQGASIAYVSNPLIFGDPAPGRIDTAVVLTTADGLSTANGRCTFYFATGTGLCAFADGTRSLAGFHATLVIGTISASAGTYSVIGKYSLDGNSGDNGNTGD